MGLRKQHTIDGDMEFVSVRDDAWDMVRLDAEYERLDEDQKNTHPWTIYHLGVTRYDLSLVREYIRDGHEPVIFRLRRLGANDWAQVRRAIRRDDREGAQVMAWRRGLEMVSGLDLELEGPKLKRERLTDKDLDSIEDYLGETVIAELGEAVIRGSEPLTEDEKKSYVRLSGDISRLLAAPTDPTPSSTVEPTA